MDQQLEGATFMADSHSGRIHGPVIVMVLRDVDNVFPGGEAVEIQLRREDEADDD